MCGSFKNSITIPLLNNCSYRSQPSLLFLDILLTLSKTSLSPVCKIFNRFSKSFLPSSLVPVYVSLIIFAFGYLAKILRSCRSMFCFPRTYSTYPIQIIHKISILSIFIYCSSGKINLRLIYYYYYTHFL